MLSEVDCISADLPKFHFTVLGSKVVAEESEAERDSRDIGSSRFAELVAFPSRRVSIASPPDNISISENDGIARLASPRSSSIDGKSKKGKF
jgi:hypothetical protein